MLAVVFYTGSGSDCRLSRPLSRLAPARAKARRSNRAVFVKPLGGVPDWARGLVRRAPGSCWWWWAGWAAPSPTPAGVGRARRDHHEWCSWTTRGRPDPNEHAPRRRSTEPPESSPRSTRWIACSRFVPSRVAYCLNRCRATTQPRRVDHDRSAPLLDWLSWREQRQPACAATDHPCRPDAAPTIPRPATRRQRPGTCARPRPPPSTHLSLIHISEPTRLGMISYAVFCLKKKNVKK